MQWNKQTRRSTGSALAFAAALCCAPLHSFASPWQTPAPIERRLPHPLTTEPQPGLGHGIRGEHLAQWMNQHGSLSPEQQQQALGQEPGFRDLPQPVQQRMRDRLAQLDAMPPDKRARIIAHTEAMERLNPSQRAEVRGAMAQLGSLPVPERHQVAQSFRALRELPPEQRAQAYATGRYGPPLGDTQRAVLFQLLRVEPLLAPLQATPGRQSSPPVQAFH